MATLQERRQNTRLPPEVNRIIFVRNLPFKITAEEMYDIFGKYGTIFQIRLGDKPDTRGTAFVVYDDIYDAKNAVDHLSGFNVCGRYLIVLYYQHGRMQQRMNTSKKRQEIDNLKAKHGLDGDGDTAMEGGQ
jgi:pre-mRNA branch site protein p14